MDLDRQSIEKRDFPIARRGYDPVAVDAHLRALAVEVQELRNRPAERAGEATLGSAAASQVQVILEAAESTAADIQRSATEDAARMRAEAAADAQATRDDAVQRAQTHVAVVSHATAALLARVESMDGEVGALVQSIQVSAGRLATDLGSVEGEMGQLYDAASGRGEAPAGTAASGTAPEVGTAAPAPQSAAIAAQVVAPVALAAESAGPRAPMPPASTQQAPVPPAPPAAPVAAPPVTGPPPPIPAPAAVEPPAPALPTPQTPAPPTMVTATPAVSAAPPAFESGTGGSESGAGGGDLDGARLVALNMALNGESREQADRYLREHYKISDRAKLLDEVYAAIEV